MNNKESEILLIRNFKKGNEQAFEELFKKYHRPLYAFIFSLTKSKEDAEEIVQNAFIKIWENKTFFKEEYPFESYLFKIAKNDFLNYARKKINRRIFEQNFEIFSQAAENDADSYVLFKETKLIIDNIIKSMPPKRREIFILQKIEGLTRKEISEKLSLSIITVDSHLMKANQQFISELKKLSILILILIIRIRI